MKNFDEFISYIVKKWKKEKKVLLESQGLGELANREYGDIAEEFIARKIETLTPTYNAFLSIGSQTPADIFALSRRNGYWHIMLIQVKSSYKLENIYELNENDIQEFELFAKFFKSEIKKSDLLKEYINKPIIISTGYCGVLRIQRTSSIQHKLIKSFPFKLFKMNASQLDISTIKKNVIRAHYLNTEK